MRRLIDLSSGIREYKNEIAIGKFEFGILLMVILGSVILYSSIPVLAASRVRAVAETSCAPNLSNHCYATITWTGNTPGAFTEVSPYGSINCAKCVPKSKDNPVGGFLTQEGWYIDSASSQCKSTIIHMCWVEGGLVADSDGIHAFWADARPDGKFYPHQLDPVVAPNGGSLDPYLIDFAVHNAAGNNYSGNTWNVTVNVYTNGSLTQSYNRQSTANQMTPNRIDIGSETDDPTASTSKYTDNQYNEWACGSGWCYQTGVGTASIGSPPYGYWAKTPCNCGGNTGGAFRTYDHS